MRVYLATQREREKKTHDFECEVRRMTTSLSMNSSFTIVITIFSGLLVAAAAAALHFPLLGIESIREEFSYFPHNLFAATFSHFININHCDSNRSFFFFSSFLHSNHFSPYNNSFDVLFFLNLIQKRKDNTK